MKDKLVKRLLATGLAATMVLSMSAAVFAEEGAAEEEAAVEEEATEEAAAEEEAAPAEEAAVDYDECEITISWWGGEDRHTATQEALDLFMEKYPGITVSATYAAWDGWEEKMATAFVGGTAQDVNQVNWNWITQYDSDGTTFLDLNTVSDVLDLSQVGEAYLKMCQIADTQAAIPVSMTGRIFYWDKTSFDEVGIAIPTTYEELLAAGEAFKNYNEDYYPLALGEYDRMILMVYYLESVYGKDWVTDNTLQYTQEEVEEGLTFIQGLEDAHVIPSIQTLAGDGASSIDQNQKWIDGKYAGIFEWDSSASKFEKALAEGREFVVGDYFPDFGDNKGGFTKVSLAWAINGSTAHPKECGMLVDFLMNDPEASEILNSQRGIPVSAAALSAADSAGLLDAKTVEANTKVLAWASNNLDPLFEDSRLKSSDGVYYDVMAGLSYGDYDVTEAAEILIEGINEVLAG